MKSLLSLVISICVMGFALIAGFRAMNAMLVYDDARIVLGSAICPVKLDDGDCQVRGRLSHELFSGDAQVTLPDGSLLVLPVDHLQSTMIVGRGHYEPFGSAFAMLTGIAIMLLGLLFPFAQELLASSAKRGEAKRGPARPWEQRRPQPWE